MRNYIVDRLDNYFSSDYTLNRVPLLIGPSGVAKSALIKQGASKYNMRLVDIRTAFMSRLDIEGLSEKVEVGGRYYSEACPMFDFIKCTDEYIRVAEECVKLIEEELKVCEDKYKSALETTLLKFKEESKVPVLIFDEITRGEPSVRQVLTKILTDKEFMNLPMKKARVVAATNSQIDSQGEVMDIYQINEAYDVAFYDRFESMYVDPNMMNSLWLDWASKNLNSKVSKELNKDNAYDVNHFSATDYRTAVTTPYKCYRTWEMLSKFYDKIGGKFSQDLVKSYRTHIVGGLPPVKLDMSEFLNMSLMSNTPALIISPSGLGKTSRVNKLAKDNNCELISINLSEVDRLDVEGMPVKSKTLKAMVGSAKVTHNLLEKINEVFKNSQLPEYCTVRAPKKEYVDKFQKAINSGKKVIIYFDECNRVQNVAVMSAVFSVISDNRLFGINFNPDNVETILSCNLSENCSDAQDLDPALCARFAIWKSDQYSESDAKNYKTYAKSADFHKVILKYFDKITSKKLLDSLNSVETRTMEMSASSSRGWEDLSSTLKSGTVPFMTGCVIFSSNDVKRQLSEMIRHGSYTKEMLALVRDRIDNWAAKDFTESDVDKDGVKMTEKVEAIISSVKNLDPNGIVQKLIEEVYAIDVEISEYRENFFKIFLGKESKNFTEFFNNYVGYSDSNTDLSSSMNSQEVAEVARNVIRLSLGESEQALADLFTSVPELSFKNPGMVMRVIYKEIGPGIDKKRILDIMSQSQDGTKALYLFEDMDFHKKIIRELGLEDTENYESKIFSS